MLENLIKTLENAPVIKKGDYSYLVQGIVIESENLREMVELIIEKVDFKKVDKIVAIQSMGLPIGTALSLETDLPLIIVKKRQYCLEGERIVHQKTGYDESIFYINNVFEGDNVVVVDDLISTGNTFTNIINEIDDIGANIIAAINIIEKDNGRAYFEENTNHELITLIKLEIDNDKVIIKEV